MAIAIAQIGTGGGLTTTLGAPISATMPAEPKQGNLLLAFCGADTIAASTASGFTNINTFGGNNASAVAAYKYAGTNESTTQTAAQIGYAQSQYNLGLVLELSGVPASGGYNAATMRVQRRRTRPAFRTSSPDLRLHPRRGGLFAAFIFEDTGNGITGATPSTGWTLLGPYKERGSDASSYPITMYVMHQLGVAAGIYTPALTITGSYAAKASCETIAIAAAPVVAHRRRVSSMVILAP